MAGCFLCAIQEFLVASNGCPFENFLDAPLPMTSTDISGSSECKHTNLSKQTATAFWSPLQSGAHINYKHKWSINVNTLWINTHLKKDRLNACACWISLHSFPLQKKVTHPFFIPLLYLVKSSAVPSCGCPGALQHLHLHDVFMTADGADYVLGLASSEEAFTTHAHIKHADFFRL